MEIKERIHGFCFAKNSKVLCFNEKSLFLLQRIWYNWIGGNIMYDFIVKNISIIETLVLLFSALLTLIIYSKNKNDDLKARATMLYFQIKEIEMNMQYIKKYCTKGNLTWTGEFHKSNLIYNNNLWEDNKIYLSKEISNDDYNAIEKFYNIATSMLNEQIIIKKFYVNSLENRQKFNDDKQLEENYKEVCSPDIDLKENNQKSKDLRKKVDKAMDIGISEYLPNIMNEVVQTNVSEFKELSNTVVLDHLKKIAKID